MTVLYYQCWKHYSHISEQHGWVCTVGLHVSHGVPLIDAVLVGGHTALIVTDPGQEETAGVVVMTSGYFANLMQRLQGWPKSMCERENTLTLHKKSMKVQKSCLYRHSPHGLHWDRFEDMDSANSGHTEATNEKKTSLSVWILCLNTVKVLFKNAELVCACMLCLTHLHPSV